MGGLRQAARSLAALLVTIGLVVPARAEQWSAAHQFPVGDIRDDMVKAIAADLGKHGIEVRVFPAASLMAPLDQWQALVDGSLDLALLPVDYVSRALPELGVLSLPGMIGTHARARRIARSPEMAQLKQRMEAAGVVVVADAWVTGALGSTKGCLRTPADARGLRVRPSGWGFTELWRAAGAEPVAAVASDSIHRLLSSNLIDAVDTSTLSMMAYRLEERLACVTVPTEHSIWFLYEPVLVSRKSLANLPRDKRRALMEAGARAADRFAALSIEADAELARRFRAAGVTVVPLSGPTAEAWTDLARRSAWTAFADTVPGGRALIDGLGQVR